MIVPPDETKPLLKFDFEIGKSRVTRCIPLWRKMEEALSTT
jgi:hypothetical protein